MNTATFAFVSQTVAIGDVCHWQGEGDKMFESEIVGHKNAPDGYLYSWVAAGALALQGFEIFKYSIHRQ